MEPLSQESKDTLEKMLLLLNQRHGDADEISKNIKETLPAIQSIVAEINCHFKAKAVHRIHADRAEELTGDFIREGFSTDWGIRVTETPGYKPNARPRVESAIGVVKPRARAMLVA